LGKVAMQKKKQNIFRRPSLILPALWSKQVQKKTVPLSKTSVHLNILNSVNLVGGFNHLEKKDDSQWEGLSHILWTK